MSLFYTSLFIQYIPTFLTNYHFDCFIILLIASPKFCAKSSLPQMLLSRNNSIKHDELIVF